MATSCQYCDGNYNGMTIGGFAVVNEQAIVLHLMQRSHSFDISFSNPPTGGDNMTWPSMDLREQIFMEVLQSRLANSLLVAL
jgi:hypothetical protein